MSTPLLPWDLILAKKDGTRVLIRESSTLEYCKKSVETIAPLHPDVKAEGPDAVLECVFRMKLPAVVTPPAPTPPAPSPSPGSWVVGTALVAEPKVTRPARGVAVPDATYKTPVYRVSDKSDPVVGFAHNDYSRRQAFNANNTRQLVNSNDGSWHIYNADTFAYQKRLNALAGDAEPQWHPTNPDLLYFLPTKGIGMKMYEMNVATNVSRQIADFGPRLKARWPTAMACWTGPEGSPSADGRYWCFMVDGDGWKGQGIVCWDMQTDTFIGYRNTSARPNNVSMSPSGRWCVVANDENTIGTVAWSPDFATSKKLLHVAQHMDIAVGFGGHDVYVAIDYSTNGGDVFMVDIDTGVRTPLFASYINGNGTAFHFSGKCYGKPGWILVTAQEDDPAKARGWPYRKIFLHELKAGGRVLNVAWHHSTNGYYQAPLASISRDGTRVAFTSSYGSSALEDIAVYQARLPEIPSV